MKYFVSVVVRLPSNVAAAFGAPDDELFDRYAMYVHGDDVRFLDPSISVTLGPQGLLSTDFYVYADEEINAVHQAMRLVREALDECEVDFEAFHSLLLEVSND